MLHYWLSKVRTSEPSNLRQSVWIVYGRKDCHLCEEVWQQLLDWQSEHHFRLEKVDVDSDVALQSHFGDHVPVVSVDGKVRFRGRVNPVLLKRFIKAKIAK